MARSLGAAVGASRSKVTSCERPYSVEPVVGSMTSLHESVVPDTVSPVFSRRIGTQSCQVDALMRRRSSARTLSYASVMASTSSHFRLEPVG